MLVAAQHNLEDAQAKLAEQEWAVRELQVPLDASTPAEVVEGLKCDLQKEKVCYHQAWKLNCEHVTEQDTLLTKKDKELATRREQLEDL